MDDWKRICLMPPSHWKNWDRKSLGTVTTSGGIRDASGVLMAKLQYGQRINAGSFGIIRRYQRFEKSGESNYVALKQPNHKNLDLLYEAMFQHRTHCKLKEFGLEKAVPAVIDIVKYDTSNTIWFTMEYIPGRLLGSWACDVFRQRGGIRYFVLMLLQLSLILEIFESALYIDHRDVKVDNIMILDEPIQIPVVFKGRSFTYTFPFRIVFIDFGFSCLQKQIDIREGRGEPPLDFCPKDGRDIFQILVSLWNMKRIRDRLNHVWGGWIRERIQTTTSQHPCIELTENRSDILWLSTVTDDKGFKAPLCAPKLVIADCFHALEGL
jgi:serine/threonine protein kinase